MGWCWLLQDAGIDKFYDCSHLKRVSTLKRDEEILGGKDLTVGERNGLRSKVVAVAFAL